MHQLSPQTVLWDVKICPKKTLVLQHPEFLQPLAKRLGTTTEQTPSPFASAHARGLRASGGNSYPQSYLLLPDFLPA